MILTGPEIVREHAAGRVTIEPFDPVCVQPNSYDFHLGGKLLAYRIPKPVKWWAMLWRRLMGRGPEREWLDPRVSNPTVELTIPPEGIVLQPGILYLGHTEEVVGSTNYVPIIAARSSSGRFGLSVYLNSGFGDLGFINQWTLELTVVHPLRVRKGDRVGQFHFHAVQGEVAPYRGKYAEQRGPVKPYDGAMGERAR